MAQSLRKSRNASLQEAIMTQTDVEKLAAEEIIELLTEDHAKVTRLLEEFHLIKKLAGDDIKQTLVEILCTELVIHDQVEQEHLYPALRQVLTDNDLLDEAKVEHDLARQLINELELMQPDDALYDAKVSILGEHLKRHMAAEESQLFARLRTISFGWQALPSIARDINYRRETLRAEFGLPDADYPEFLAEATGQAQFTPPPLPRSAH
jgi:hemerythrin superfamily protein